MREFIKDRIHQLLTEERIPFNIPIPSDIQKIAKVFNSHGYKIFLVGGAVRDSLLNKKPKDFDLATDAVPDKVEELMAGAGLKTLPTGKAFGVINVFTPNGEYEIATFRSDIGSGRRPDAVQFTDMQQDTARRDLTINALFYDIDTHEIVDLVGGVEDLKNGVVRTVGSASDRFGEDRLRILRAIRFAGRFGGNLDPSVDQALTKDASLEGISGERIRDEFIKGVQSSRSVTHFLTMLQKYGLCDWIFKGLKVSKNFIEEKDIIILLADLLKGNEPNTVNKRLNELKYSVEEIRGITFLLHLLKLKPENAVQLKRMQKNSGVTAGQIETFGRFAGMNQRLLKAFLQYNLSVSGDELIQNQGLKPGKELGDKINSLEYQNFLKILG